MTDAGNYARARSVKGFNNVPPGWTPQCVIIEGMVIINTSLLGTHRLTQSMLFRRFIIHRGCREVHVLFHNPERLKLPKNFERDRRDKASSISVKLQCQFQPNGGTM